MDIFERINKDEGGPLGQYRARGHGYFTFPKLEGEIAPRMRFNGHEVLCWSLNNYLGLSAGASTTISDWPTIPRSAR